MPNMWKVQSKIAWSCCQESFSTVCPGSHHHGHRLCDPWPILLQADSSCHAPHNAKTDKPTTAIRKNKMTYHHFLCLGCWWQIVGWPCGEQCQPIKGQRNQTPPLCSLHPPHLPSASHPSSLHPLPSTTFLPSTQDFLSSSSTHLQ